LQPSDRGRRHGLGIGVALALVLARVLTRVLTAFLHGVAPSDPATFAGVVAVTGAVSLAASAWPARRAARADHATVLHAD
jgi:ABC-type antimicrobial peptide transport system permease subunit